MLGNARQMARIAHAHGKQAVIDEAWLYKELRPAGGANVAATAVSRVLVSRSRRGHGAARRLTIWA